MNKPVRLNPTQRVLMIRKAGAKLALEKGVRSINHATVAEACPIQTSANTVRRYMGTQVELVNAIVDEADDADLQIEALELGY